MRMRSPEGMVGAVWVATGAMLMSSVLVQEKVVRAKTTRGRANAEKVRMFMAEDAVKVKCFAYSFLRIFGLLRCCVQSLFCSGFELLSEFARNLTLSQVFFWEKNIKII